MDRILSFSLQYWHFQDLLPCFNSLMFFQFNLLLRDTHILYARTEHFKIEESTRVS